MAEVFQAYTVVCHRCKNTVLMPARNVAPSGDRGYILGSQAPEMLEQMVSLDIVAAEHRQQMVNVTPPGWNLQKIWGSAMCDRCKLDFDLKKLSGKRFADAGLFNCDHCGTENSIELEEMEDKSVSHLEAYIPEMVEAITNGTANDDVLTVLAAIRIVLVDDVPIAIDRISIGEKKVFCVHCGKENELTLAQPPQFQ